VPPEDLDHTLREIATRYNELRRKLQTLSSDDPVVIQLRQQADSALEAGEFDQAGKLLNQARDRDLEVTKQLQDVAHKRFISAAASAAAMGNLKWLNCRTPMRLSIFVKPRIFCRATPKSFEQTISTL
jgi:uncharacterized caspase-like protein